jgi:hypothetical protein
LKKKRQKNNITHIIIIIIILNVYDTHTHTHTHTRLLRRRPIDGPPPTPRWRGTSERGASRSAERDRRQQLCQHVSPYCHQTPEYTIFVIVSLLVYYTKYYCMSISWCRGCEQRESCIMELNGHRVYPTVERVFTGF